MYNVFFDLGRGRKGLIPSFLSIYFSYLSASSMNTVLALYLSISLLLILLLLSSNLSFTSFLVQLMLPSSFWLARLHGIVGACVTVMMSKQSAGRS